MKPAAVRGANARGKETKALILSAMLNQESIDEFCWGTPGLFGDPLSIRNLAFIVGRSRTPIHYHLGLLQAKGLVAPIGFGVRSRYVLTDTGRAVAIRDKLF